jgi:3-oxoacyl-[acyl-carrier protein] reductase
MEGLNQKVAIVTGASKGIGRAICLRLAREGVKIVAVSRTIQSSQLVADQVAQLGSEAMCVEADLLVESNIPHIPEKAINRFGHIDILINNAAFIPPSMLLVDYDPVLWRKVIDLNLTAPAFLIKAVLPSMIANHSGKIINISSIGGRKGGKGRSAYRASKAGLINLTESVAAEVKSFGIDVICICPSATDTEGYRETIDPKGRDENPGVMRPEEIAEVVAFLASEASSAITGTAIDTFGGTNPLFT